MALLLYNISRDIIYLKDLFFSSLRLYKYIKGALEITFNSGIILNVANVLFFFKIIPTNTKKLLFNGGKLRSNYSFQKSTNFKFKVLKPPFILLTRSRILQQDKQFLIAQLVSLESSQTFKQWFRDLEEEYSSDRDVEVKYCNNQQYLFNFVLLLSYFLQQQGPISKQPIHKQQFFKTTRMSIHHYYTF